MEGSRRQGRKEEEDMKTLAMFLLVGAAVAGDYPPMHERVAMLQSIETPNGRLVGDHGRARGILQIHPETVRQANKIMGYRRWRLADRDDAVESAAMCRTILRWAEMSWPRDSLCDHLCRWNRPDGRASAAYRRKVELVTKGRQ
jgi:hypothetical protein